MLSKIEILFISKKDQRISFDEVVQNIEEPERVDESVDIEKVYQAEFLEDFEEIFPENNEEFFPDIIELFTKGIEENNDIKNNNILVPVPIRKAVVEYEESIYRILKIHQMVEIRNRLSCSLE